MQDGTLTLWMRKICASKIKCNVSGMLKRREMVVWVMSIDGRVAWIVGSGISSCLPQRQWHERVADANFFSIKWCDWSEGWHWTNIFPYIPIRCSAWSNFSYDDSTLNCAWLCLRLSWRSSIRVSKYRLRIAEYFFFACMKSEGVTSLCRSRVEL